MSKTKADKLAEIHEKAVKDFNCIVNAVQEEREMCREDRRFYSISGAQWEGALEKQFANRPRFEVNKVHLAIMRIFNEYRNNRISVDFVPKNGEKGDKLADICDQLYRADEQDSCAEEAYDNAFEEGVGGGIGAWRLTAEYEDEYDDENDSQRIKIQPIYDADACVFFDLDAKRQDKSDAKYCFVLSSMTKDSYREEYGDEPDEWPNAIYEDYYDWASDDSVKVAEYYKVDTQKKTVHIYESLDGSQQRYTDEDFENDEELMETLLAVGSRKIGEKKAKQRCVKKYIMSGGSVLEDCGVIAGDQIPIVPFYGKRWFVDNIERCMGHVRLAKDSQRLKNMQLSRLGEISALSTIEKPIFAPEQVAGHESMWSRDNIDNNPYLLNNPIVDEAGNIVQSGPTSYTKVPNIPPAMAALLQITEQDIKDILGNQENGEEVRSNISGSVVEMVQERLDMQAYIYMSNMSKAVKRSGEIWLSMARDLYIEDNRKMKLVSSDKSVSSVSLNKPIITATGERYENDISNAKFDLVADVGPSSNSKRNATVRSLSQALSVAGDPETVQTLVSLMLMNMEGEGLSDARKYFRMKLVRMGVVEPSDEEAQKMAEEAQNQQPDANEQYLMAEARKADALAQKAIADTQLQVAKTDESQSKTLKNLADIQSSERQQTFDMLEVLKQDNIGGQGEQNPPSPVVNGFRPDV